MSRDRYPVKSPYGKPDKRGKYPYQKLHDEIDKLPEVYRDWFYALTTDFTVVVSKQFYTCFRMYMAFDDADLMDYDESRGRL